MPFSETSKARYKPTFVSTFFNSPIFSLKAQMSVVPFLRQLPFPCLQQNTLILFIKVGGRHGKHCLRWFNITRSVPLMVVLRVFVPSLTTIYCYEKKVPFWPDAKN